MTQGLYISSHANKLKPLSLHYFALIVGVELTNLWLAKQPFLLSLSLTSKDYAWEEIPLRH